MRCAIRLSDDNLARELIGITVKSDDNNFFLSHDNIDGIAAVILR